MLYICVKNIDDDENLEEHRKGEKLEHILKFNIR